MTIRAEALQAEFSLKAEVARLKKLLPEADGESAKNRQGPSPSGEAARLRKERGRREKQISRLEDWLIREAQVFETHMETIR